MLGRASAFLALKTECHRPHAEAEVTADLSCPCVTFPFPPRVGYSRSDSALLDKERSY